MQTEIVVCNEFERFEIYDCKDSYRGLYTKYLGGNPCCQRDYSYPKRGIPEALLSVLCEIEKPYSLNDAQEELIWSLVDDEYEI